MSDIVAPTNCPSCGSVLEWVNDQLFCRSNTCPAQNTKKIQHFCKVLKIKGFGEKTLDKLELTSLGELLTYSAEYGKQKGLGDKGAQNLEDEVSRIKRTGLTVTDFISACSIPLIGSTAARKLSGLHIDNFSFEVLRNLGLGEKAATNLMNWHQTEWVNIRPDWLTHLRVDIVKESTVEAKGDVCITGKLNDFPSRNLAKQHLEEHGWTVKSSVTKSVQYLISEDGNTTNSSYKKAINNGIRIVTIKELLEDI